MMLKFILFALVALIHYSEQQSPAQSCDVGTNPINYNSLYNAVNSYNIQDPVSDMFPSDGQIKGFELYVKQTGKTVYFVVYRDQGNGNYKVVGFYGYTTSALGFQTITLQPSEYINFEAGDMLGSHWRNNNPLSVNQRKGCYGANNPRYHFYNEQIVVNKVVHLLRSGGCYEFGYRAITNCGGSGGEPHFMMTSGDTHMCFNLHGDNEEIFNLITDKQNELIVNGKTFEVQLPHLLNKQSYFSDIGISSHGDDVVFSRDEVKLNGRVWEYKELDSAETSKIQIKRHPANPSDFIVTLEEADLLVTRSSNRDVENFMGVYILSSHGLSSHLEGIIGQFVHSEFRVESEVADRTTLHFNDDHESIEVTKLSQHMPSSKRSIHCYYFNGIKEGGLIGDKHNYLRQSIVA